MPAPSRLAEIVGALSVASDLGKGFTDGQALRTCVLTVRLADAMHWPAADVEAAYWVSLLRFVGCTATASEMAHALGDEIAVSAAFATADGRDLRDLMGRTIALLGRRPDRVAAFALRADGVVRAHETASCEVARLAATRLGLPGSVISALGQGFERWDGRGNPGTAAGDQIAPATRLVQVATVGDLLAQTAGVEEAVRHLRARSGSAFDPEAVAGFADHAAGILGGLEGVGLADLLAVEPHPVRTLDDSGLDQALPVFGAIADMKSPYLHGHSQRVAELAESAARCRGLSTVDCVELRRAGWLHDVGRIAVSSRIWDKDGKLSEGEWEHIRLHPHHSQRILRRSPALTGYADLAACHHERVDGSGYPTGRNQLGPAASVLAAADVAAALGERRPHREALPPKAIASALRAEAAEGRLDAAAVDSVLEARGHPTHRTTSRRDPLTAREREVLATVALGLTNRQAAARLGISPKTVNAHLEHLYPKLGVTSRAAAVFHAVQEGLIETDARRSEDLRPS